jgi:LuxR family transcriptional regulator, maltose regulon positive regulatory protein
VFYNGSVSTPILATKLYVPRPRPKVVTRLHLIERLIEGLHRKLTLISAPAGFGKTTLISEWVADCERPVAWLSLDEEDSDPGRFLSYFIAGLRTVAVNIGEGALGALQSPQPALSELVLTSLLNEVAAISENFIVVLDDYHVVDSEQINHALEFMIERLPPQMHLVIATREDPDLPLSRLRARDQLTELRAADLRLTLSEASAFLNQTMGLHLSAENITALETRTEGWVAGLQLAAISMQGQKDASRFIQSFTGSHHFVIDYLVEEVLGRQPDHVQRFLLRTSILERLCGPLCDALLLDAAPSGQQTLEYLEHANLFLLPLDNERRWYRYHHLFADLLRQRLYQSLEHVTELHTHASQWYEDQGLEVEAFHHAAAANDIDRAERLIEGRGLPLQFRGASAPILNWLKSLPKMTLDTRPSLWVTYASTLLFGGQHTAVEQTLQAAEVALAATIQGAEADDKSRDLVGRIASMRATLAVIQHDAETIIYQSQRALEYLHPANLPVRTATTWSLGYAYQLQGNRAAASQAYNEVIDISKSYGNSIYTMAATLNLGQIQEADNQLPLATRTYRRVIELAGDPPQGMAGEAYLGLARIYYEWNDLDEAEELGRQCLQLTRQMETISTSVSYSLFLARLSLAQGDVSGAVAALDEAEEYVRRHNFIFMLSEVAAIQVPTLLRQGNLTAAAHLAQTQKLPLNQARVSLAQGNPSAALAVLEPWGRQMEAKGWSDERLRVLLLQAIAHYAQGNKKKALQVLGEALELARPGGFIRIFVDEGLPMFRILSEAAAQGLMPDYVVKLLAAFKVEDQGSAGESHAATPVTSQSLVEPLSERELEVLRLLGTDLNGPEIARELLVSLNTMRTHTKNIYNKLGVNSRRTAVRRAQELNLL